MPRVTDYPTKTTPASNDLLLIVDLEDNTESAQGSTKAVTVGSLATGASPLDWINVKIFGGAVGNGIANDTTALQNSLNAARAGQVVYFPDAVYGTTAPLVPPPGVIMVMGLAGYDPAVWGDSSSGAVIKPLSTFSGNAVIQFNDVSHALTQGPSIYGGAIDGSALLVTADGIRATGPVNAAVLRDFFIANVTGAGINCVNDALASGQSFPYGWHCYHVKIDTPGAQGVVFANHTDASMVDVHVINSGSHGWSFAGPCPNSRLSFCKAEWTATGFDGFHLTGSWGSGTGSGGMVFHGCSTDRCGANGAGITATGNVPVSFVGCMFRRDGRNGGSGGGSYAGVNINGATIPLSFDGIQVWPGVDDNGSGTSSPQYGVSLTNTARSVTMSNGYVQGNSAGIHDDATSTGVMILPTVITASGPSSSPTLDASLFQSHVASPWLDAQAASTSGRAVLRLADTNASAVQAVIEADVAVSGNPAYGARVTGDGFNRYRVLGTGQLGWGPGTGSPDTDLYRGGVNALKTDGSFTAASFIASAASAAGGLASIINTTSAPTTPNAEIISAASGDGALGLEVAGDSSNRLRVNAAGDHHWGPGNATQDTNLYRNGVGLLKTDNSFTGQTVAASGLTGATAASRLVGATTSGPPTAGTFAVGDVDVDQTGRLWVCVSAGTPGTWVRADGMLAATGDTTGIADLANFNTIIGLGGPLLLDPRGTYYINGPMTALPTGFLFDGGHGAAGTTSGPAVIKLTSTYSSATAPITFASASSEQEIRNIAFDATAPTAGTCDCINQTTGGPVTFVKLRNLLIIGTGFTSGIHVTGTGGNPSGWAGERIRVRSVNGTGILLVSATDGTWTDVQAGNCGVHGWSLQGCQNSRFTACRSNQNTQTGFSISGSGWGTGAGSGGANFTGCTTDRNTQSGVSISSTGTGPMVFSGCTFRRDGSDGNAARAGLLVSSATNPVVVGAVAVFPGVNDDGSGTASPALGVSVSGSTSVTIDNGYVQGVTTAISNGGSNTYFYVGPGVQQATGGTATPTIANANQLAIQGPNSTSFGSLLSIINTASAANVPIGIQAAATTDQVLGVRVAGDTFSRFRINAPTTGQCLWWGSGALTPDTTLYRSGVSTLKTDGAFVAGGAVTGSNLHNNAAPFGNTPSAPNGTTSLTLVMMGLGSTWAYTPTGSGSVVVTVTGFANTSTAVANLTVGGRYGTGTAPINGAAVSGTRWGALADPTIRAPGSSLGADIPFSFTALLSLTPSTAYWFDLALATVNGADQANVHDLSITIFEAG